MGARHLDCDGGLGPRKGGWLHTSCWDAWRIDLKQRNRKNSIAFGREDELKSIF